MYGAKESMITELASGFTGVQSVRNLTPPTMPLYPPRDRGVRLAGDFPFFPAVEATS